MGGELRLLSNQHRITRQDLAPTDDVLGFPIAALDAAEAVNRIVARALRGEGGFVCVPNAHVLNEAQSNTGLAEALRAALLLLPDSMVLQKARRFLHGRAPQQTLSGVDLMAQLCTQAAACGVKIGLHGGSPETMRLLVKELERRLPTLQIAYAVSPPFGALAPHIVATDAAALRAAGVQLAFIGLGAPKQERWMHLASRQMSDVVQIGVGAAFDGLAGTIASPPAWMHQSGLGWAFRLATEPKRLWRRYLGSSPKFLLAVLLQKVRGRHGGGPVRVP
jgi:N-acetylglucosaminyldiphosphoundecaprenol N-acetyl-beta-D-mannosaminyltransferase